MLLKRFRGETVQDALRAVREAMGADALVLSTRIVPAAGWRGLIGRQSTEITAAVYRPELSEIRHLEAPLPASLVDDARDARALGEVAARLVATGLHESVARDVAVALPRERRRAVSTRALRRTLATELAPLAAPADAVRRIEVFVGPPGVGKTTTIAKIAARERARGGRRLRLVAADGFRVGAVEQLRLFADIIGAPLTVARSARELDAALAGIKGPVLLDTAGRSPQDDAARDILQTLAGRPDVRMHLVLAASTPAHAARRILDRFADSGATTLAITKLDEADTLAPLVSLIRDSGLRVSYLGTGQNVPDDLEIATPATLAAWVAGDAQGEVA